MTTPFIPLAARNARVSLVIDTAYAATVRSLIDEAWSRVLVSMFIVDITPYSDRTLKIDTALVALADATWRGADVRLIIGGARDNTLLVEAADAARLRARELGIQCRWLTSSPRRGSHAKFIIADDRVLTGSHNWSPGAFGDQTQDSALVESESFAEALAARFEAQWRSAGGE